MSFLGILDGKNLPRVPGTIVLDEYQAHSEAITSSLKHGTGKFAYILLSPQPSDDPNEPLKWPMAKRITCVLIIFWGATMYGGTVGPLLNTGLFVIAREFNVTVADVVIISAYQLLIVALTGPIISAIGRKWGKRPCLLISCLQRGPYTAMGNFVLAGVANLCGIVTGSITNNLGWKYLFHILVALEAAQFILQFLFVPKTSYNRAAPSSAIQTLAVEIHDGGIDPEKNINRSLVEVEGSSQTTPQHTQASTLKKTYWQKLAIFTETYSDENMLQLVLAPFAVCLNLAAM